MKLHKKSGTTLLQYFKNLISQTTCLFSMFELDERLMAVRKSCVKQIHRDVHFYFYKSIPLSNYGTYCLFTHVIITWSVFLHPMVENIGSINQAVGSQNRCWWMTDAAAADSNMILTIQRLLKYYAKGF